MDRKVIAIAGLPASGKTFLGKALAKQHQALMVDDPTNWQTLEEKLLSYEGQTVIIADPFFCMANNRDSAECRLNTLGYSVEWIFFANDPDQCQVNASTREEKPVTNEIKYFSSKYQIPAGADIRPVWKQD